MRPGSASSRDARGRRRGERGPGDPSAQSRKSEARVREREAVAEIGVFGGSGFYSLLENPVTRTISTPYGQPSDAVSIGEIGGRRVAFMPRHGGGHRHPAHAVNYR